MLPPCAPAKDDRRRCTTASLCLFGTLSLAFICLSALSSGDHGWLCPNCDRLAALRSSERNESFFTGDAVDRSPPATNISHVVFGIGASARTWDRRRSYSELWWRPGLMRGHVWLDEAPTNGTWHPTSPPFRVSADAFRFGERADAARMARIVAEECRLREAAGADEEEVRWYVMGDDDTVFFVDNLVETLGKYDHREMYYVGAASESVEQDEMHSYGMAFGGGGFAVSAPAARALAGAIDGCLQRYAYFYGSDQRVQSCLAELGVPLTREPGFHQVDLRGDAYGMLAAHPVAPLISLHHLDHVDPIAPHGDRSGALQSLVEASRHDPGRTLQQCFCYEANEEFTWSVSVSWGYTVQLYPWSLAPKDLEVPLRTFKTWRSFGDGPFTFNTRPLPAEDRPCERPLMYFLDRVEEDGGATNATLSEYTLYRKESYKGCNNREFAAALKLGVVRVFAPKMDPSVWRKAPRRQCCQTRRRLWGRTLEVRIRNCGAGEITSPP